MPDRARTTEPASSPVGTTTWFSGRVTCLRLLEQAVGSPGDWRMIPTVANGQPAAAAYLRDASGTYQPFGLAVLTPSPTGITRVHVFSKPTLVTTFGLPQQLDSDA